MREAKKGTTKLMAAAAYGSLTVRELANLYDALILSRESLIGSTAAQARSEGVVEKILSEEIERMNCTIMAVADEMAQRKPNRSDSTEVMEFSRFVLDWNLHQCGVAGEDFLFDAAISVLTGEIPSRYSVA